jgi:aryl-alcohol dehydrogenase-like predicted oxidoreductase
MSGYMATKRVQHPGLQLILDKLHRGSNVSDKELQQLQRQIADLENRAKAHRDNERPTELHPVLGTEIMESMLPGHATCEGTQRRALHFGNLCCAGFYRNVQDMLISSIGIGTYRGAIDNETDAAYASAVHAALESGVNLIDTSLNYRSQRSERAVAAGIRRFVEKSGGSRDEIVVSTKGGYLLPEAITPGTLGANDVVGGTHSLAPAFLADQIDRSRRNLGLETIDIYYIHNPETQLAFIEPREFMGRVHVAFNRLERAASDGLIRYYGTATWNGYRGGDLSLRALARAAQEIAGDNHHFRFVQLPFNLGMREALTDPVEDGRTILDTATELRITVIASASLLQGRLSRDLPDEITRMLPTLRTDAQRAIQFARSTPGIASALVGMADKAHLVQNLAVAHVPTLTPAEYQGFGSVLSGVPSRPA